MSSTELFLGTINYYHDGILRHTPNVFKIRLYIISLWSILHKRKVVKSANIIMSNAFKHYNTLLKRLEMHSVKYRNMSYHSMSHMFSNSCQRRQAGRLGNAPSFVEYPADESGNGYRENEAHILSTSVAATIEPMTSLNGFVEIEPLIRIVAD